MCGDAPGGTDSLGGPHLAAAARGRGASVQVSHGGIAGTYPYPPPLLPRLVCANARVWRGEPPPPPPPRGGLQAVGLCRRTRGGAAAGAALKTPLPRRAGPTPLATPPPTERVLKTRPFLAFPLGWPTPVAGSSVGVWPTPLAEPLLVSGRQENAVPVPPRLPSPLRHAALCEHLPNHLLRATPSSLCLYYPLLLADLCILAPTLPPTRFPLPREDGLPLPPLFLSPCRRCRCQSPRQPPSPLCCVGVGTNTGEPRAPHPRRAAGGPGHRGGWGGRAAGAPHPAPPAATTPTGAAAAAAAAAAPPADAAVVPPAVGRRHRPPAPSSGSWCAAVGDGQPAGGAALGGGGGGSITPIHPAPGCRRSPAGPPAARRGRCGGTAGRNRHVPTRRSSGSVGGEHDNGGSGGRRRHHLATLVCGHATPAARGGGGSVVATATAAGTGNGTTSGPLPRHAAAGGAAPLAARRPPCHRGVGCRRARPCRRRRRARRQAGGRGGRPGGGHAARLARGRCPSPPPRAERQRAGRRWVAG